LGTGHKRAFRQAETERASRRSPKRTAHRLRKEILVVIFTKP
jgi:hypothetical protein